MKLTSLIAATLLVASPLALAPAAFAGKAPVQTGRFSNTALQGYDAVAYFTSGEPTKGSKDLATTYEGADFHFASQENLDTFKADPAKYAPQYGGYCAWAVSQGYTAPGNAKNWKIVDGKLYLNYNKKVQETWEKNISGFVTLADANWPTVLE